MKTLWLFLCSVLIAGCATTGGIPQLIVRKHQPQIQPIAPPIQEIKPDNPLYSTATDPSLVAFINVSDHQLHVTIDGQESFFLLPGKSKCFAFPIAPGRKEAVKHTARVVVERPTRYYGSWDKASEFTFYIRLDGKPQMFYLYDR